MKNKISIKSLVKLAGNLVVILALVFLVKKFMDMDVDFSQLASGNIASSFILSTVIQALLIVMACFPWLVFTQSLSGKKIPYSSAMPVYTRSNIYKYLPGNVFQYVGRNQLASDMNISHVDVACATVLDVFFCVLWTGVISVILLGTAITALLEKYGRNILIIVAVGVVAVIMLAVIVRLKFMDKVKGYLSRYSKAFEKENRGKLIQGVVYYLVHNSISALMYFLCLALVFGDSATASELVSLTGAFLFAWIIGFVTPGAPGGIGVRESVMIFVCGEKHEEKVLLFVLVMRIASVVADLTAFLIGHVYLKIKSKKA